MDQPVLHLSSICRAQAGVQAAAMCAHHFPKELLIAYLPIPSDFNLQEHLVHLLQERLVHLLAGQLFSQFRHDMALLSTTDEAIAIFGTILATNSGFQACPYI